MKYVRLCDVEELLECMKERDTFNEWSDEWNELNLKSRDLLNRMRENAIESTRNNKCVRKGTKFVTSYGALAIVVGYDMKRESYLFTDEFANGGYAKKGWILNNLV